MLTKPRNVPPALTLRPEVNLLTQFAVIATSSQSPLVREVSGKNADARRREDDSPPSQLADFKQMVCDGGLGRERHMPNLSQFVFVISGPVLGVNARVIVFSKVCHFWPRYQRKTKRNCFEKSQLITSFRDQSSRCHIRMLTSYNSLWPTCRSCSFF